MLSRCCKTTQRGVAKSFLLFIMISLPRDRMDQVVKRFEMLEAQMAAGPAPDAYVKMASEYSEMQDIVGKVRALRASEQERDDLQAMLADKSTDAEMQALAEADLPEVEERIEALQNDIQILLLPKDAADERNAILEIRAGTGGDEAALFAGDLYRMYERYAGLKAGNSRWRPPATARSVASRKSSPPCRARASSRI